MGVPVSKEIKEQYKINRQIELELRRQQREDNNIIKLLLLGAAETGKSTILKQMKILHENGYTDEDRLSKRFVVYANILNSMSLLLKAMQILSIKLYDQELQSDSNAVLELTGNILQTCDSVVLSSDIFSSLKKLWDDIGVQKCYNRNNEFLLPDSAKYFLDNLDRISHPNYIPTQDDILRTRVATTGIIYVDFKMKGLNFRVCDVGGQRSERKKWIHCFDNVTSIVFVASLSEYDQVLLEDSKTQRMQESIRLFYSIANSEFFTKASIILFLNKKDIFREKLKRSPMTIAFPDYKGANVYDEAVAYIEEQYRYQYKQKKQLYVHQTCATDTGQIKFVLDSAIDTIIAENFKTTGLSG